MVYELGKAASIISPKVVMTFFDQKSCEAKFHFSDPLGLAVSMKCCNAFRLGDIGAKCAREGVLLRRLYGDLA